MYLFARVRDVAAETGEPSLPAAAERFFRNVFVRRMYITGGVGSTRQGEAFTHDFSLPNDTAYAESCAAIGLAFFVKRLLDATGNLNDKSSQISKTMMPVIELELPASW